MKISLARTPLSAVFAAATLMYAGSAAAQARYEPAPMVRMAQADADQTRPPVEPRAGTRHQQAANPDQNQPLSQSLSQSHGVIEPPSTGDKSVVSPLNAGKQSMPVIAPPGAPGGNENVQPK
jgi:hypothetical protein